MTKEDVMSILAFVEATYPSFKVQDRASTKEAWSIVLEPYDAEAVRDALVTYIRTNPSKFAPSPAELIGMLKKFESENDVGIEERVAHIRKAISNSNYNSKVEFAKLDRVEQKAVGSPDNLRYWAMYVDPSALETVIFSALRKAIPTVEKREQELAAMPDRMRLLTEKTVGRLEEKQTKALAGCDRIPIEYETTPIEYEYIAPDQEMEWIDLDNVADDEAGSR